MREELPDRGTFVVEEALKADGSEGPDMISGKEDEIRKRAHEIWEQEGRPAGRAEEHWEQARREIEEGERAATPEPGEGETEPLAHSLGDPEGNDVAPGPQVSEGDAPEPPKRRTGTRKNNKK